MGLFAKFNNLTDGLQGMAITTPTPEPFEVSLLKYLNATEVVAFKVFPYRVPQSVQGVYPRAVYTFVSGVPDQHLTGPSGLMKATVQFDIESTSDPEALTSKEALRLALEGYRGSMGNTSVQNVVVHEMPCDWEALVEGQDKGTFTKTVEYEFTYTRQVPTFSDSVQVGSNLVVHGFGGPRMLTRGF